MGFDVNFSNKPIIKEAQAMQNDGGGAGNLGYFEQGEKDKQKNASIFSEQNGDSFKLSSDVDEGNDNFSISKLIAQVILAVKDWLKKTFKI